MLSAASLTIDWLTPDIHEESREFFTHPAKQEWYRSHAVTWDRIVSAFNSGELLPYPRSGRIGEIDIVNSYHRYDDYQACLVRARRGYRKNYTQMESDLQRGGSLTIKAPIILACNGEGLLFSGYRRLCLAWNYGMIPYIWLVKVNNG